MKRRLETVVAQLIDAQKWHLRGNTETATEKNSSAQRTYLRLFLDEAHKPTKEFSSRFPLYERVLIDKDDSIAGTITAICFRSYREPLYEVSWIANGQNQVAWIEEPRLDKAP